MSALVAAELLKFRTTRTAIGILLAAVALTAIGAAGTVGTANEAQHGTTQLSRDILSSSLFAALVAFLAGILCVTVEWRHGTVTRTLLVTPRRGRVLVAKELWVAAFSAILAAFALLVVVLIAVPWLVTLYLVQAFAMRIAVLEDRHAMDAIERHGRHGVPKPRRER